MLLSLTYPGLVLSAGFLNDTITLIFTPLTLSLTLSLGLNPIAYLLSVAGATNIGSVVILSGNLVVCQELIDGFIRCHFDSSFF
ncbi:hypothetical protein MEO43_21290, partial [Dolichospermum sp. ST_sed5]|nr:hypothetical protein [Dolichospermum sp. ST_sed5]